MKKIITTLTLISLAAVPFVATADQIPDAPFESVDDLITKMDQIGDYIFTGLLVLAAIFLVVAGYFFVTASGNAEKIKKAREMLINALIGVAVGVAAKGLIAVIQNIVQG